MDLKGWSRRATLDLAAMRRFGQTVYAATDEHLASTQPAESDRPIDLS